jgi:hypothetical protein
MKGRQAAQPVISLWVLQLQFLIWRRLAHALNDKSGIRKGIGQIAQRSAVVAHLLSEPSPLLFDQFGIQISGIENA